MRILLSFRDAYKLNGLKHDVTDPEHRLSVPIFELIVYKNPRALPIVGFWIYNESSDTLHDIYVLSVLQSSYCFFRGWLQSQSQQTKIKLIYIPLKQKQ